MKRSELGVFSSLTRRTSIRVLVALGFLYMLLVAVELPFVLRVGRNPGSLGASLGARNGLFGKENLLYYILRDKDELARTPIVSGLNLTAGVGSQSAASESAKRALDLGGKLWREIESVEKNPTAFRAGNRGKSVNRGAISNIAACPDSISLTGEELKEKQGRIAVLPCGLTLGSHVTVIGRPTRGHSVLAEPKHKDKKEENGPHKMVSQFVVELLALKMAEGEDPPRVMRFNPWIQGDRTGKPVITLSICYRKQWGAVQRCDGRMSEPDEGTVDGLVRCEKWSWHHDNKSQDSAMGRLSRLMGGDEPSFPFAEEKLFMLTLTAGSQGYHMSVDGRHVASFPNRQRFDLEDATGIYLGGDIDIISVFATSLPASHASSNLKNLNFSDWWRAPPVPDGPVRLFIGILSAGNHFADRMAARKSWMQHWLVRSSHVVVRFFVALHPKKEVNAEVKGEAELFGDVVMVPYLDHYDLVVLKTVALCEFGVRTVSADYIMKADDDTFIRVDGIVYEIRRIDERASLYMGNMNYNHMVLRNGKWAVTEEVFHPGVVR